MKVGDFLGVSACPDLSDLFAVRNFFADPYAYFVHVAVAGVKLSRSVPHTDSEAARCVLSVGLGRVDSPDVRHTAFFDRGAPDDVALFGLKVEAVVWRRSFPPTCYRPPISMVAENARFLTGERGLRRCGLLLGGDEPPQEQSDSERKPEHCVLASVRLGLVFAFVLREVFLAERFRLRDHRAGTLLPVELRALGAFAEGDHKSIDRRDRLRG